VSSHPHCPFTHSLLLAGHCDLCGQPVVRGQVTSDGVESMPPVPQWEVSAVLAALAGDPGTAMAALAAVSRQRGDLFAELPIYRVALGHSECRLGQLAESRLTLFELLPDQAERCELCLREYPQEFALRLALLGYYFLRSSHFPEARAARQAHTLWVIEHQPGCYTAGTPFCLLEQKEGEPYQHGRALWLRHVESPDLAIEVLGNAASFFTLAEPQVSERLYQRAKELEPGNQTWPKHLAQLYKLRNIKRKPDDRRPDAALALEQLEQAYRLSREGLDRAVVLISLAKAAYDAGEWARARDAAEELLQTAAVERNPADMLHAAHTVLGRLALRAGDLAEAKRRLAYAADALATKDWVHAPGPRELWLARELLERGERAAVVEYLHECSRAWRDCDHRAEIWASAIERGEMTDFRHFLE
jgi:hypothetical protein